MSIAGKTYLERGKPVVVLVQWGPGQGDPAAHDAITWYGKRPKFGPRNVLIERGDGTQAVRPFRGLRKLARGSRGTGRGKGVDSTDTLAAQSAEDEREAS